MRLLLVVGSANDIFIFNYAKWLKESMSVKIDVFEFFHNNQQELDLSNYDNIASASGFQLPLPRARGLFDAQARARRLNDYIKDKEYDIIHIHWVVAPVVLQRHLQQHCKRLVVTFWGGEFVQQKILYSRNLYYRHLSSFVKHVDCIINSKESIADLSSKLASYRGIYRTATLGSAPLESLYDLMDKEDKTTSKKMLGVPENKLSVLIGYSGKALHRHAIIIEELKKYPQLQGKVHLLAPMTRGCNQGYVRLVEGKLKDSGFTYSLISGKFLSDSEIARVRNATDITLQLSEFDGFSRSIIECLCAESLLIYGSWLGYEKYLSSAGFEGIEVSSLEEGVAMLPEIVNDFTKYKQMNHNNKDVGRKQSVWSECIKDWVNIYKELIDQK